jgi:hypothetical protein
MDKKSPASLFVFLTDKTEFRKADAHGLTRNSENLGEILFLLYSRKDCHCIFYPWRGML